MKTIYLFIALGCALLLDLSAVAHPITVFGPVDLSIRAVAENLDNQLITSKTNIMGTKTNFSYVYKSNTTNFTMNTSSLLSLLANSYNSNFPAGTQLLLADDGLGFYKFAISDQTGTNISFFPTVLQTTFSPAVFTAMKTESTTNQLNFTGNFTASITSALVFTYDDSTNTTGDGTITRFTWSGLAEVKQSANLATSFFTENVTMNLTGGSEIFRGGSRIIFTGTMRAKLSGVD
jgi:hypothetical protein